MEHPAEKQNDGSLLDFSGLSQHRNRIASIEKELDDATKHRTFTGDSLAVFVRDLNRIKDSFQDFKKQSTEGHDKTHDKLIEVALTCLREANKQLNLAIGELVDKRERTKDYYDNLDKSREQLEELLEVWPEKSETSRSS